MIHLQLYHSQPPTPPPPTPWPSNSPLPTCLLTQYNNHLCKTAHNPFKKFTQLTFSCHLLGKKIAFKYYFLRKNSSKKIPWIELAQIRWVFFEKTLQTAETWNMYSLLKSIDFQLFWINFSRWCSGCNTMMKIINKDLHNTAFNFQTCIVFPRPISSPRIQPCSHSKQRFIHLTPSSWYPRKWIPCKPLSSKSFWDSFSWTYVSVILLSSSNFLFIRFMKIVLWRIDLSEGTEGKNCQAFKPKPRKNWAEWRAIPSSHAIRIAGRTEADVLEVGASKLAAKKVFNCFWTPRIPSFTFDLWMITKASTRNWSFDTHLWGPEDFEDRYISDEKFAKAVRIVYL